MSDVSSFGKRSGKPARKGAPAANANVPPPAMRGRDAQFDRAANEFSSDAAAIEEAPVPLSAHAALYIVLIMLITAVTWSIIGTVDRIVVAQGKIATKTSMIVMQPFTTSRVVAINVKQGDHVKKGQVLAEFDPAFAQADVSSVRQKVASLTAMTQRLEAQLAGRAFVAGGDEDSNRLQQAQIYAQEMSDYQAELNQRASRLDQIDSQIQVDQASIPGIRSQLGMANRVVDMQSRLQRQQAAATLDVLRAQSSAIDATNRLNSTLGDEQKLQQQRNETVQERQAYLDKWHSDHNQQLVQARQDLAEASETLNKANRMHDFTQLISPVDGTVQEVADRSIGSVMREAETVVTIVPDNADLYVEANVPARDVSYLELGDTVRVKLESYPFQRFGTVNGTLTVLSPDSLALKEGDDASKLVYRAQVRLNENAGVLVQRGIHLKPGLVASAEIKTGNRSIASYILNPILRVKDESLREP